MEQLPLKLRTVLLFAFCKILNSHVFTLYEEFVKWQKKMRLHASASPQACMIKKIVRDEIDIDIQIEEGNGKPVDFIIKTSFSNVDKERQLFAILDRYKLAGKTYGYENAEIILSALWSEYMCEKGDTSAEWKKHLCELADVSNVWSKYVCESSGASASWTGYVCELAEVSVGWSNFVCEKIVKPLNIITADVLGYGLDLKVVSTYPVETPLTIFFLRQDNLVYSFEYTGSQMIHSVTPGGQHANYIKENSAYINVTEDNKYEYTLINK